MFNDTGDLYFYRYIEEYDYGCGIPNHGENCTRRFPLNDIREADSNNKFGYPDRYRQKKDIM